MRLVFSSDLHIEYHLEVVGLVAARARELLPDVLVLAGDLCPDLRRLERALRLLVEGVGVPVLYLPGNHELWCGGAGGGGPHSRERYEVTIPGLVKRSGALSLGVEPRVIDGVGFVGVTGWYDYSLRDPSLEDLAGPVDYASGRFGEVRCVDGSQVFWPGDDGSALSDVELSATMCGLLENQLDQVEGRSGRVVVVLHMLPARSLILAAEGSGAPGPGERSREERFLDAYLGAAGLGDLLRRRRSVVRVICGHLHRAVEWRIPAGAGEIPCEISPVGYPRELEGTLPEQVARRLRLVEV